MNNAGYGGYMPFINLRPDQAEALIRMQVVALARRGPTASSAAYAPTGQAVRQAKQVWHRFGSKAGGLPEVMALTGDDEVRNRALQL